MRVKENNNHVKAPRKCQEFGTFKKCFAGIEMINCQPQKVEESIFSLTAWGRGTWGALKLLPDFFPKVRDDVPGVSCGYCGFG